MIDLHTLFNYIELRREKKFTLNDAHTAKRNTSKI